jgi:predicted DsbA family dithiol-disulfide isomerase
MSGSSGCAPNRSRRCGPRAIICSGHGSNRSIPSPAEWAPIKLPTVSPQPHTHLAFEGYQFATEHGKGNDYNHRVLQAFFVESQDIGQIDVLTKLAGEVGLEEREFEEALRSRKYRAAHQRALRHAYKEAGITGVPMFVIGGHVLTGLQDRETLAAVIEEERTKV